MTEPLLAGRRALVDAFIAATGVTLSEARSVLAEGEGFVGDDEPKWRNGPEYARRSMVQTRAIGRACRAAFAFVVPMSAVGVVEPLGTDGDDERVRLTRLERVLDRRRHAHVRVLQDRLEREQLVGYGKAERLGSLEVDDKLKFSRVLDGEIARSGATKDFVDVDGGTTIKVGVVRPIRDQPSGIDVLLRDVDCGQPMTRRQLRDKASIFLRESIDADNEPVYML